MNKEPTSDILQALINNYNPCICSDTRSFPISAVHYTQHCNIKNQKNPLINMNADHRVMYEYFQITDNESNLYLDLNKNTKITDLIGSSYESTCYVHISPLEHNTYHFLYFYLTCHEHSSSCCCCSSTDIRINLNFIIIEVQDYNITRIYYDGIKKWMSVENVEFKDSHPLALFSDKKMKPITSNTHDLMKNKVCYVPLVDNVKLNNFNPDHFGWIFWPGLLDKKGTKSPYHQHWWDTRKFLNKKCCCC